MGHRKTVALQIRRIVADVYGRSIAGTTESTEFNSGIGRNEIRSRIAEQLGVTISKDTLGRFYRVGQIIDFVQRQIELEYAHTTD